MNCSAPPGKLERLIASSFYLGTPPLFLFSPVRKRTPFLRHHVGQALALFAVFFGLVGLFLVTLGIVSTLMLEARGFYEAHHPEPLMLSIFRKFFLCWLVFLAFGLGTALAGSESALPLVGRLGRIRVVRAVAIWTMSAVLALCLAATPVVLHAASLARAPGDAPPSAYMLYEDVNIVPRWVFELGFYRASRAAGRHWPPPAVKVVRISPESIAEAKARGRFVFIGSHGLAHGLLLESGWLTPEQVAEMPAGGRLEFVYLTGCDSGAQKAAWEKAFTPARVVTYNRLTSVFEHAWWLWTRAPQVIEELAADEGEKPAEE